ncbi:MAG: TIGR04053 family radical SAM/SPASM domain-containing protein [Actinobacteria bacterium]|nr:TIGR04053 family radical SAM/SPASM domain-containing protein [Actinomycetota bacterium]MCL6104404.1 TIGR04053 family radical SAM/SPASM domain-containing protein [Actinomycetota bacterium]
MASISTTDNRIRQVKFDLDTRPFMAIWEVTRACDLACKHCRAEADTHPDPDQLTTKEGMQLIDQLAALGRPRPLFILSGGDPFKREDLFKLVEYAASQKLAVSASPSPTPKLTRSNLQSLKQAGANAISLSLDGATAQTHDAFRQVDGSYDLAIKGAHFAKEVGLRLQINTTVTPHNLMEIPEIFGQINLLDVMTWSLFFLVPTGRGRSLNQISPQQFEDILNIAYDLSKTVPIKTTEAPQFRRVMLCRQMLESQNENNYQDIMKLGETYNTLVDKINFHNAKLPIRPPMEINAAKGFVFISHTGDVYPSGFFPLSAGNIRNQPLVDIYKNSSLFKNLRDVTKLEGRCNYCEFNQVCGGSRSRAFSSTGNPFADDPLCIYHPHSFRVPKASSQLGTVYS